MSPVSRLPGLISDYFIIEALVASTRTSDAFKALDKFKRQSVGLWKTRRPLGGDADQLAKFGERVVQISRMPGVAEVLSYGVDAGGCAFVVFPVFDGLGLLSGNPEGPELERRFLASLRIIERFHASGMICGDLCLDSFLADRSGNIRFVSAMGAFDGFRTEGDEGPPPDSLHYLAPEQKIALAHTQDLLHAASGATAQGDVYALGIMGYRMFAGVYPSENELLGSVGLPRITTINPKAPLWTDEVLGDCFQQNPAARYATAGALLTALNTWRETVAQQAITPALIDKTAVPQRTRPGELEAVRISVARAMGQERKEEPVVEAPKKQPLKIGVIGAASIVGLLAVAGWIAFKISSKGDEGRPADVHLLFNDGANGPLTESDRLKKISLLVASDDPLSHDALIRELKEATTPELKDTAWRALLDRARRLGMIRSSDQLRSWIKTQSPEFDVVELEALLRCIDAGYPMEARLQALTSEYPKFQKLVLRLTAALALDLKNSEAFRDNLATMAIDSAQVNEVSGHSALSIMLLLTDTSTLFLDDIVSIGAKIPDEDLKWLLLELSKQNAPHLQSVADLIISRKLYTGVNVLFLEVLRRKSILQPRITNSLVNGVLGRLVFDDVATFGSWYDQDADKVLLAVVLASSDESVSLAAFDALAGKPINSPFLSTLLDFIRTNYKDKRLPVARLAAVIALKDSIPEDVFVSAFTGLDGLPKSRDLVLLLLKSDNADIVKQVIDRYSGIFSTTSLLELLEHKDKLVRLAAVRQLKGANDIGALKMLLDGYDKERDPDVKQAYEENILVVRERRGVKAH